MAKTESSLSAKKLVICCDGTWNNSDNGWVRDGPFGNGHLQNPSNVTHIARALLSHDTQGVQQIVYYQAGIGSSSVSWTNHMVAGVTGAGMSECIREAYSFIANNYAPGDSIFVLGFSRGAFTARSVAGMIGGIGLLTKNGIPHFYSIFSDYENAGEAGYKPILPKILPEFKLDVGPADFDAYLDAYRGKLLGMGLTQKVQVTAVGVWDTVGTLGIPIHPTLQTLFGKTSFQEYQFYDTKLGNHIEHAFQALALDEQRATFVPTLWERPNNCTTKLKQVWFAGAHSNVGGGVDGVMDTSAADIALAWMMSNLSPWLAFNDSYLAQHVVANRALYTPSAPSDASATSSSKTAKQQQQQQQPRYGCGPIEDSSGSWWWRVSGSKRRTPNLYHEVEYHTNKALPQLLDNTNEMVHASVRARVRFGGRGVGSEPTYRSRGLADWAVQGREGGAAAAEGEGEAAGSRGVVAWGYVGKSREGVGMAMREDQLGGFERELMRLVDPAAEGELFGGGGAS